MIRFITSSYKSLLSTSKGQMIDYRPVHCALPTPGAAGMMRSPSASAGWHLVRSVASSSAHCGWVTPLRTLSAAHGGTLLSAPVSQSAVHKQCFFGVSTSGTIGHGRHKLLVVTRDAGAVHRWLSTSRALGFPKKSKKGVEDKIKDAFRRADYDASGQLS